mgnify:FL=1
MKQLKLSTKCNHDALINFGFKKYGMNYKMFVPLYQSNNETLIELEILISSIDRYIGYDVIDKNTNMIYTPYYDSEYSDANNNLVLARVKNQIEKIFNELRNMDIIE